MNLCPDWYNGYVSVIQPVVYCFGCQEKGVGLNKFLALNKGKEALSYLEYL